MKPLPFSPARAALIAGQTFREASRQRLSRLLVAMIAASTGAAVMLRDLRFGASEQKFILDAGFGAEALFGSILAVVATAQLFSSAIEERTVLMVLAKPVGRAEFVLGKFGGALLLLFVFCTAATAVLLGVLWWRQPASAGVVAVFTGVLIAGAVQWLKLGVLAAVTLLVASYARSGLLAVMAGFAALVAGHLQYLARDFYATAGPAWAVAGVRLLGGILPDFQLFNVADQVSAGGPFPVGRLAGITVYALAYMGVFSALSIYCFQRREL